MSEVNLVGITKPNAGTTGCFTADELIAYTARVSNPNNQNNTETAPKLISYLIRENHWSPFEMVSVTMEIKTTRDISRQIIRHRSFSFQEFSQRYAVSENFTRREARLQDTKNRQNSVELDGIEDFGKGGNKTPHERLYEDWSMRQARVINTAKEAYEWALNNGIAKEQARAVLPEGNTETTLYMAGTLRSWIHYCDLRRGNGTQKEHMVVADQVWDVLKIHFPDVTAAVESLNV
jgi:thymidylate synthase (FAD)